MASLANDTFKFKHACLRRTDQEPMAYSDAVLNRKLCICGPAK